MLTRSPGYRLLSGQPVDSPDRTGILLSALVKLITQPGCHQAAYSHYLRFNYGKKRRASVRNSACTPGSQSSVPTGQISLRRSAFYDREAMVNTNNHFSDIKPENNSAEL